jgi:hypothetical protein
MRPFAHPDGFDACGLADQLVPSITAMIDDLVVGFEDAVLGFKHQVQRLI